MDEVRRVSHVDATERKYTFELRQDVEDILETNKALAAAPQKSDWGRHTARIPNVIFTKWLQEEWERGNVDLKWSSPEFAKIVQKKLQDPENRAWRVDNPSNPFYVGWKKG